jgi:hypothetical protein
VRRRQRGGDRAADAARGSGQQQPHRGDSARSAARG